jgi:hypothetical protein
MPVQAANGSHTARLPQPCGEAQNSGVGALLARPLFFNTFNYVIMAE